MTMEIHSSLKDRLVTTLSTALSDIRVQNGMFLAPDTRFKLFDADNALPNHGALRNQLKKYIDEDFPLMKFVNDVLQDELLDREFDNLNASQRLVDLSEYSDVKGVAERLVSQFSSLPWKYTLTLRLPYEVSNALSEVFMQEQLSDTMRLVRASEVLSKDYPLDHPNERRHTRIHKTSTLLFPKAEAITWPDQGVFLQIDVEGFIGPYGGSAPDMQAEHLVKAFFGLGIALRMFEVESSYFSSPPSQEFYCHKHVDGAWLIDSKVSIGSDAARVISNLKLHDVVAKADGDEKRKALVKLIVSEMKAVLSAGERAGALVLAAEWLLESYSGQDARLSYVQSMIVLEVLLGDKAAADEIGLGQLLRNRCAYLIGKSHEERKSIMEEFDDIYRVRSQIVHSGKPQLTFKERLLFGRLRKLCEQVVQKEVDLLRGK